MGKRSWGPTRALIGEASTDQANSYVKVGEEKKNVSKRLKGDEKEWPIGCFLVDPW